MNYKESLKLHKDLSRILFGFYNAIRTSKDFLGPPRNYLGVIRNYKELLGITMNLQGF